MTVDYNGLAALVSAIGALISAIGTVFIQWRTSRKVDAHSRLLRSMISPSAKRESVLSKDHTHFVDEPEHGD